MSTIPSWARPGAEVVCVSSDWVGSGHGISDALLPDPVKGETYTIDDVEADPDMKSGVGVWLRGFHDEGFYCLSNFRPVTKRTAEQDIAEHFSHHLRQPVRETERAE